MPALKPLYGLVIWALMILALLLFGLAVLYAEPAWADDEARTSVVFASATGLQ